MKNFSKLTLSIIIGIMINMTGCYSGSGISDVNKTSDIVAVQAQGNVVGNTTAGKLNVTNNTTAVSITGNIEQVTTIPADEDQIVITEENELDVAEQLIVQIEKEEILEAVIKAEPQEIVIETTAMVINEIDKLLAKIEKDLAKADLKLAQFKDTKRDLKIVGKMKLTKDQKMKVRNLRKTAKIQGKEIWQEIKEKKELAKKEKQEAKAKLKAEKENKQKADAEKKANAKTNLKSNAAKK
jgi:hypothetical protein